MTTDAGAISAHQTPTVHAKMTEHFDSAVAMRRALAFGDLEAFRAAAATLSGKELSPNLSESWKPHLEGMRSAAKRARDATSTASAARALADVGRACAACHEKLGGPKLVAGEPPAPGSGTHPHMLRHQWAVDRLWNGLIGPSQESWVKGAEVFTDAPLEPDAVAGQKTVAAHVPELAKRAHAYGEKAHAAGDSTARAAAFTDVFSTCTTCHAELGVKAK